MCPQPAPAAACRNCGASVTGDYCAACGQETQVKLPTARVFLREATGRYVALDGRLWRTLAALLFRPGFLTREYLVGRRRRYIRPARLFLVLSLALFAAIRFLADAPMHVAEDPAWISDAKTGAKAEAEPLLKFDEGESGGEIPLPGFTIHVDRYMNLEVEGVDSAWARDVQRRLQHFNRLNRQEKYEQIFLGAVRYGPYAMFVLMPAFALLQMLVYLGRGRPYPDRPRLYAEHLVFAAHTHAFLFLVGVLALALPFGPISAALEAWCLVYMLWATKAVYRGRWLGVVARAFLVGVCYSMLFGLVVAGLVLAAILLR
jgi:hypothetical protein